MPDKMKTMTMFRQAGLTLVEMMVSIAIAMTVLSGVVQVLVVSKSNFITERELAALQENARFAMKFLSDEIRMAGFSGCSRTPLYYGNSVNGSAGNWLINGLGLQGFEYDAGINSFPVEFRSSVAEDTDAIVIRRAEMTGLRVTGHVAASARLNLGTTHSFKRGQILVVVEPNCTQIGVFQVSNPANTNNNASHVIHNTGNASPGNCTKKLAGNFNCASVGNSIQDAYANGSSIMTMQSQAFFIGASATDATVPALFRQRLVVDSGTNGLGTVSEELVQGIENMQILYGLDLSGNDGVADRYMKANGAGMNWNRVVSVRLSLRMRSLYPVYNDDVAYGEFEGVDDTDGADRFMRQTVSTTITLRNPVR